MALPVLFTSADAYSVDVALGTSFTPWAGTDTVTLELNPSGYDREPEQVELTREHVRVLRDALDALLGEKRATLPW